MRRLLLTGGSGVLGAALVAHLRSRGGAFEAWSGSRAGAGLVRVDLTDPDRVAAAFGALSPEVVIHAAALARIGDCCKDPQRAQKVNAGGTALLAELCSEAKARLVLVSTDLVFDGEHAPYRETDPPAPLSVYGRSKADAERCALAGPGNAVARVSLLFGPSGSTQPSFFDQQVRSLRSGEPITLFADEWRTPIDLETAAEALTELALSDAEGVFHVGGPRRLSRWEMGRALARALGVNEGLVKPNTRRDVPAAEPRPRDTSLDSSRWRRAFPRTPWRGYEEALGRALLGPSSL
jgi:dTDP-4-dehydrorhamnose reductase